jgi:hypothetical protein
MGFVLRGKDAKGADIVAIGCTDEDMRVGGFGPLPLDPRSRHSPTDEEQMHIFAIQTACRALEKLGWRHAMYAPRDNSTFLSIGIGSTGIHETTRHEDGSFWIYDGDVWPATPGTIMWKPLPPGRE